MDNLSKRCEFYNGVCALDELYICYTNAENCSIYKDYLKKLKERNNKIERIYPLERSSEK